MRENAAPGKEVLLTSFRRWHQKPTGTAYSIAVYQPRWLPQLPETRIFDIRTEAGRWTRPRDFVPAENDHHADPELLGHYRDALLALYETRRADIEEFVASLGPRIALCCWCPYDESARRQLDQFGSFVCHSAAVELFLDQMGVTVIRDEDRCTMVHLGASQAVQLQPPEPELDPQLSLGI